MKCLLPLVACVAVVCAASRAPVDPPPRPLPRKSADTLAFDVRLYRSLPGRTSSVAFCPVGVAALLGAMMHSARGWTRTVLNLALQKGQNTIYGSRLTRSDVWLPRYVGELRSLRSDVGLRTTLVSRIWVNSKRPLKQGYVDYVRRTMDVETVAMDVQQPGKTVAEVNDWVRRKTKNKIRQLVSRDDIREDLSLLLVNAMHLKADWMAPFYPASEGTFTTYGGVSRKEMMMGLTDPSVLPYGRLPELAASMVALPLKYSDARFYVLLPDVGTDYYTVERKLSRPALLGAIASLNDVLLEVYMPKFKIESKLDLSVPLKKFIPRVFSNRADFGGMTSTPVKIDRVAQKTFLSVDENGLEAAAATSFAVSRMSLIENVVQFRADRPFIYFLMKNNTVMMMGRFV